MPEQDLMDDSELPDGQEDAIEEAPEAEGSPEPEAKPARDFERDAAFAAMRRELQALKRAQSEAGNQRKEEPAPVSGPAPDLWDGGDPPFNPEVKAALISFERDTLADQYGMAVVEALDSAFDQIARENPALARKILTSARPYMTLREEVRRELERERIEELKQGGWDPWSHQTEPKPQAKSAPAAPPKSLASAPRVSQAPGGKAYKERGSLESRLGLDD